MEGLDFRSTSAPDIPYESSGKPVCHTLVKLFHYRDRVGDLMRSRFVQSVLMTCVLMLAVNASERILLGPPGDDEDPDADQ